MNSSFWRNRRVTVTGGAGFIGSHLTEQLVQLGSQVRVVDSLARGRLSYLKTVRADIEFIQADLTLRANCERACAGQEIVFHLASKVGGIGYYMQRPGEVFTNNVLMDTEMAVAARQAGVTRYLFASSAHVYPRHLQSTPDATALKEADATPADPAISYGWGKLLSEKMLLFQNFESNSMRTAIARIVGAYGERQDIDLGTASAIPAFCRRAIEYPKLSPFTILGQGLETRSYCYVGDVVEGLLLCLEVLDQHEHVGPVNLGAEGRVRIGDIAKLIIEISGKNIDIQSVAAPESGLRGQAVDCTLLKQILVGWTPKTSLQDGLKRAYTDVERQLSNPED